MLTSTIKFFTKIFLLSFFFSSSLLPAASFNWVELFPNTTPPARQFQSMSLDNATGQVILFGGENNNVFVNETWIWDGTTWTQATPANSPGARTLPSLAFDPISQQLLLFGGYNGSAALDDTWAWNGSNWIQLDPANSPSARTGANLALDPVTNRLILFGGAAGAINLPLNDTWTWTGTNWEELTPVNVPPARSTAAMDGNPVTSQLVLFGGFGATNYLDDTWVWNGTNWIEQTPLTSPPYRAQTSMIYDSSSQQLLLFGGITNVPPGYYNDSWLWNGNNWIEQFPATSPANRSSPNLSVDPLTNYPFLFGGFNGTTLFNDNWLWEPTLSVTSISPTTGAENGGTIVTITGVGFNSTTSVQFGQIATSFTIDSDTQITAISPAGSGTVAVTVTTSNGTSTSSINTQFTYLPVVVVLPINHLEGYQKSNKFANQADYINVLKWDSNNSNPQSLTYKIYRNAALTKLVAVINPGQKLRYEDHNRKKDKNYTYYIVAVNSVGITSTAVSITVKAQ